MKLVIFFVFIIVSANSFAEPELPKGTPFKVANTETIPAHAPGLQTNQAVRNLLREQTTRINALSSKLDLLDERIKRIENGPH